ncbi:hypothetical protein GGI43DRAFT_371466 [Trichoderma evansii]
MSLFKRLVRPIEKLRDRRGFSKDADANNRENKTTDLERENDVGHMEQHEAENMPSLTINGPLAEQKAVSSLPDLESLNATTVPPKIVKASITPPESIWNEAYDSLKAEEPKLVQAYEKILSIKLNGDAAASVDLVSEKNIIQDGNASIRRAQMYQLVDNGLNKTTQEANIKSGIGTAMQVVNTTKRIISDAIRDIPQAALPWAVVCVSLEILTNPVSQTEANRTAVKYIGDTIKWYWEHATRLFDDEPAENRLDGFQRELQMAFVDFYKKLLRFQMNSICNYYRHRGFVFLRDLVKLDDWDGSLKSIREDDDSLRKKVNGFLRHRMESHLEGLTLQAKARDEYQRTQEDQQCLRDLFVTDPRDDKTRIEDTKGGLLEDAYRWILENPEFQAWHSNDQNWLLWLSGDPGKGKTMLLCGIAQELMQQSASGLITFFFYQATILSNSDYVAALRSLMWLLADQQPSLISYIRSSYDKTGKALFDGANAWYKLSQIFSNMLCDSELPPVYIIIDALDECTTGRTEFLHLIQKISILPKVKLLVSSRNWPEIGGQLINEMNLSLEVNAGLVKTAVELYISYKASQLSILHDEPQLKGEVCHRMRNKANGTFLWVAIVFKSLDAIRYYDDVSEVLKMLDEMPEDLTRLYTTMLERISLLKGESSKLCRTALGIATLVYRPLHLNELSALAGFQSRLKKLPHVEELIKDCGSFLTVQKDKIYFIHQSAKEYLVGNVSSHSFIFPDKMEKVHSIIISNSLDAMSQVLRKNIYKLEHPGVLIDDVCPPMDKPLDPILYSCANWVAHLCEIDTQSHLDGLIDKEKILGFLKTHFLHWLEALSLTGNLPINTSNVKRLNKLLKQNSAEDELQKFVHDASRFIQYSAQIIETAPMQIYLSAILFSPWESLVRSNFIGNGKLSSWITSTPPKDSHWGPCLHTIEARNPVAVDSRDMSLLILSEDSENVEIWDMALGKRIHILNHIEIVYDAVFSSDSKHVLTVTPNQFIFWDMLSGDMTVDINIRRLDIIARRCRISKGGKFLAAHMYDGSIQICNVVEGTKFQLPLQEYGFIRDIKWSNDSKLLYIEADKFSLLWDVARGTHEMKFGQDHRPNSVQLSFSKDSDLIVFIDIKTKKIVFWDLSRDERVPMIGADNYPEGGSFTCIEFSNDSKLLAVFNDPFVQVWDVATGTRQHNLNFGTRYIHKLKWSSDASALAVVFHENVEIYDLTERTYWDSMLRDKTRTSKIIFSVDSTLVATMGEHLRIWDSTTGSEIRTFPRTYGFTDGVQFSQDSKCIYTYDIDDGFDTWDIVSGSLMPRFLKLPARRWIRSAFSMDGRFFALNEHGIQLWSMVTNEMVPHSIIAESRVIDLAFSNNADYLVLVSEGRPNYINIDVWNVATGEKLWTIEDLIENGEHIYINKRCGTCGGHGLLYQFRSIAVSDDGMVLCIGPFRHEMMIWSEGKTILELSTCFEYFEPYFDIESPYIITQLGRIHLDKLIALAAKSSHSQTIVDHQFMTEGYGISSNGSWITWNGENILWLPPDYRPAVERAISRHCIVIVTTTTEICIISFSGPPPFELLS